MRVDISRANVLLASLKDTSTNPDTQFEYDLTDFRDPMGNKGLMASCQDGRASAVKDWIKVDPRFQPIYQSVLTHVKDKIDGGGKWISFGFRDYHGKWKAVAVTELITDLLIAQGYDVGVIHAGL